MTFVPGTLEDDYAPAMAELRYQATERALRKPRDPWLDACADMIAVHPDLLALATDPATPVRVRPARHGPVGHLGDAALHLSRLLAGRGLHVPVTAAKTVLMRPELQRGPEWEVLVDQANASRDVLEVPRAERLRRQEHLNRRAGHLLQVPGADSAADGLVTAADLPNDPETLARLHAAVRRTGSWPQVAGHVVLHGWLTSTPSRHRIAHDLRRDDPAAADPLKVVDALTAMGEPVLPTTDANLEHARQILAAVPDPLASALVADHADAARALLELTGQADVSSARRVAARHLKRVSNPPTHRRVEVLAGAPGLGKRR